MPLESLAQAMNRISSEVRGGPLSRMARGGRVRMADGGPVYDPMGNVTMPPSEGFAPSPMYEKAMDAIAKSGAAMKDSSAQDRSYRSSILPISRDAQGNTRFDPSAGILGSLYSAAQLPGDVYAGRVDPMSEKGFERAQELAQLAMTGGFGGVPAKAGQAVLGSGPVRKSIQIGERELPIRGSTDDLYEVMEANASVGRAKPNTILPIDKIEGGVNLNDPKQRARVDVLKEKIMGEDGHISRIIVDQDGNVIEGQHRFEALRELGAKEVPVEQFEDMAANINMGKLKDEIHAVQPMGTDRTTSLIKNAFDILKEEGSVSKIREDYIAPEGYEKSWNAILDHLEASFNKQITPKMRESILRGQPHMAEGGAVSDGSGNRAGAGGTGAAGKARLLKLATEHGLHRPQIANILRQNDPRLSPVQATARAREIMAGDTAALHGILSDRLMADLRRMLKGARP